MAHHMAMMAAGLVVVGHAVAASAACTADTPGCLTTKEVDHFNLMNAKRAEGFTCPKGATFARNSDKLVFDCRLWRASQLHSLDMGENGYFSHNSQDGRSPWDRARAQGLSANGENIAAGRSGAADVLTQWLNSDGHCKNIGNSGFKMAAVGYAPVTGSAYRHYWTQMFRSSLSGVTPDLSCVPAGLDRHLAGGGSGNSGGSSGGNSNTATTEPALPPAATTTKAPAAGGGGTGLPQCASLAIPDRGACESCLTSSHCDEAAGFYCCPYMKKCINAGMSCRYPIAKCQSPTCSSSKCSDGGCPECNNCGTAGPGKEYGWLEWVHLKNSNPKNWGDKPEKTCTEAAGTGGPSLPSPTTKATTNAPQPKPPGAGACAVSAAEAAWRMWGTHTCQQMQKNWQVCTTETDPNHATVMRHCPAACSDARNEACPGASAATTAPPAHNSDDCSLVAKKKKCGTHKWFSAAWASKKNTADDTLQACKALAAQDSYCGDYIMWQKGVNCGCAPVGDTCEAAARQASACDTYKVASAGGSNGNTELSGTNDGNAKNLQACIGECDADSQCAAGLKCFQRDNLTPVPGCKGAGTKNWDYCYKPNDTPPAKEPTTTTTTTAATTPPAPGTAPQKELDEAKADNALLRAAVAKLQAELAMVKTCSLKASVRGRRPGSI